MAGLALLLRRHSCAAVIRRPLMANWNSPNCPGVGKAMRVLHHHTEASVVRLENAVSNRSHVGTRYKLGGISC
jgi:hypothetical protein